MAGINDAIAQAEQFEAEQPDSMGDSVKRQTVRSVDPLEAAANTAESWLKVGEAVVQSLVDNRIFADDAEVKNCRQSLAPAIDKYNLTAGDNGRLPYQEEISAGFYLGGLIRRFRKALAALRARDEKAKKEQEKQQDGSTRKHAPTESPRALPSNNRVREKSDPEAEGWSAEQWG